MNRIEIHKTICDQLHTQYQAKNSDYGNSFAELRKEYPNSVTLRLSDKLNRLKTLMGRTDKQPKVDESIEDTLMDLANYAIMEVVERRMDELARDQKRTSAGQTHTVSIAEPPADKACIPETDDLLKTIAKKSQATASPAAPSARTVQSAPNAVPESGKPKEHKSAPKQAAPAKEEKMKKRVELSLEDMLDLLWFGALTSILGGEE